MNQNNTTDTRKTLKTEHILLSMLYLLCSALIPALLHINMGEWLPSAICLSIVALSIFAFSKLAGSFRRIFNYALIIIVCLFISSSFVGAGTIAAYVASICIFSYLCLKAPLYLALILPIVSYVPSLIITKDPLAAAIVFIALPASCLLAYSIKKQLPRVSAICHITTGFCISLTAVLLSVIYVFYGKIDATSILNFADYVKVSMTDGLRLALDMVDEGISQITGDGVDLDVFAENIVTVTFNIFPAIIITAFNLLSYMIHSLELSLVFNDKEDRSRVLPMLLFEMSVHSAFIFIISLVLSFVLTSGKWAIYGTAAENMMIILIPGFVLTSLAAIRSFMASRAPSCIGFLLYMFLIFMIASLSYPIIIITSLFGAIINIVFHFRSRKKK